MQTYAKKIHSLLRHSASAIVIATACVGIAGAASAADVTVTSGNVYDLSSAGTNYVVSNGVTAEFWDNGSSTPATAGNPVLSGGSWIDSSTGGASTITVSSGGTLIMQNPAYWSAFFGLVNAQAGSTVQINPNGLTIFMGVNTLKGNVVLADNTQLAFGQGWNIASPVLGTSTNFIMGSGNTIDFYVSHSNINTISTFRSTSAAAVNIHNGTLIVDGINTAAQSFFGAVTLDPGATFTVGDATHSTAVFGDVAGSTTTISVGQSGGTLATLSGYGTIYGSVTNAGIVKPGGTTGTPGTLTIKGDYTQTVTTYTTSQLVVDISSSGVSKLVVGGKATLSGSLVLNVEEPTTSNGIYDVLTANSVSGSFSTYTVKGDISSALIGVEKTSTGYAVVEEKATSAQIVNHAISANLGLVQSFNRTLLEQSSSAADAGAGDIRVWAQPFARVDNVGVGGVGYNATYGGIIGGVERRFADAGTVAGFSFAYGHGSLDIKNEASTVTTNSANFAVYGGTDLAFARVDGVAYYDIFSADTKRDLGTYGKVTSSPSGYSYGASFQISRDLFDKLITPFARGLMSGNHMDSDREAGNASFVLDYDAKDKTTFAGDVGVRVHAITPTPDFKAKVDFTVAVSHDFSSREQVASGTFVNVGSTPFAVTWKGNTPNSLLVGTEFSYVVGGGIDVYGRVNGQFTNKERAGELYIGGRYKF